MNNKNKNIESTKGLIDEALSLKSQESHLIDTANIDTMYQDALSDQLLSKIEQAERIEDKLELIINNQQAQLQKTQSNRPSFLSMPGARKQWQTLQSKQQARLQLLHSRLDVVKDMKNGNGLHLPKIEELAALNLKKDNPELVKFWNENKQAERKKKLHKMQEIKGLELSQKQQNSRGLKINMNNE